MLYSFSEVVSVEDEGSPKLLLLFVLEESATSHEMCEEVTLRSRSGNDSLDGLSSSVRFNDNARLRDR